jgi:hypothetical protein
MSLAIRVVNPILSQFARGYRQRQLVARELFPLAPVMQYGGQVLEFGKESFRAYVTKRAPGANKRRIRFGYTGKPYSIIPSDIEGVVPFEHMRDAAQVPGIDLGQRAISLALNSVLLTHEIDAAALATNAANYPSTHKVTLTSTARWTSPDSDPIADIAAGRDAVATSTGMDPNTLVLSRSCYYALQRHPDIINRVATNITRTVTLDTLQAIFEVPRIIVAAAIQATGVDDTLTPIWGDDAVLAYVPQGNGDASANAEEPGYGYTYYIDGHPVVEEPYQDRNASSWIYPVAFHQTPVLSGILAGYLFKDAGAAFA